MKNKFGFELLLIGAILIGEVSHADQDKNNHQSMTFIKESAITTKIKAKLAKDQQINTLANIHVATDAHGVVVLSGYAKTREQADRAVVMAINTEGVADVQNHIKLK